MELRTTVSIVIVFIIMTSGLGAAMSDPGPDIAAPDVAGSIPLAQGGWAEPSLGAGPIAFTLNEGQFGDDDVVLYADLGPGGIAFKAGSVLINLEIPMGEDVPEGTAGTLSRWRTSPERYQKLLDTPVIGCTVRINFEGCNDIVPRGVDPLPGEYSYFLGDGPVDGISGVPAYSRVVYERLYDGIDLVYMMTDRGLKYEFIVAPGADPGAISILVDGHEALSVRDGALVIGTAVADILDTGLDVFYEDGARERLPARFDVLGPDRYGFTVNDRDPGRPLVIDPLVFSTYLGTPGWETGGAITVDDEGYIYVTGASEDSTFPTTTGAYQEVHNNFFDVFVTKLEPDGTSPVFSTFIGGTDTDLAVDIVLDDSGNVYVCGGTSSDNYPTTKDAFQSRVFGNGDGFVSKLSPDGSRLIASTIIGGSWEDMPLGMVVDDSGNMYITGSTRSHDFPTTEGAFDVKQDQADTFVTKVNSTATGLVYSTYLGGSGQETGGSIALADTGSVYVVGITWSDDFPVSKGAKQVRTSGSGDGFVTRLDPNGTSLEASSYLGGQYFDEPLAVVMDKDGDVHIMGNTRSDDFPVTAGAFQTAIGSARDADDAFATRMNWNLSSIVTSTFIGGDGEDYCPDGVLDEEGNVVIGGYTSSATYPVTDGAYQTLKEAFDDAFITKLSADYTQLEYSSYLGSVDTDLGVAVAAFGTLNVYVLGETFSDRFPTTSGAFQTQFGGNRDAFVAMFSLDLFPPVAVAGPDVVIDQHEAVQFNGSGSWDNIEVVNWTWTFTYGGKEMDLFGPRPLWTFDNAGLYQVTLTVADGSRHEATDTLNVTVLDITVPIAEAGLSKTIRQGETVQFDGSDSTDNVGVVNWSWAFEYFDQQVVLQGELADFEFARAGEFNVTLTVWDAVGLNATDNVIIDVMDLTSPVANAGEDIQIDQHQPAELNGSLSTDTTAVVNWTWSFVYTGSPVVVYGEVTTFTFDIVGTYDVILKVADASGNHALDTVTVLVRDSTPPSAVAGPDQEVVEGTLVLLDGAGSTDNVGIVSYEWTFEYDGETMILDGVEPSFTFNTVGTYPVTLNATDAEGNSGHGSMTVTVLDITPPLAHAGDDRSVDQGVQLEFDGTSSTDNVGITTFEWSFEYGGEVHILNGATPAFTFHDAVVMTVILSVLDAAGHSATDEVVVTVRDITPPVPVAGGDRAVDQGGLVSLDASASTDNVGITSYRWSFEEGGLPVTLEGVTAEHTFNLPGTYDIVLEVTDLEDNSAIGSFVLRVIDTIAPTVHADVDPEVGRGDKTTFDASGSTDNVGIIKWTWTFEDGDRTMTLEGEKVEHAFDTSGDHKVTLTLEDAEGNQAMEDFTVTVTGNSWLYLLFVLVAVVIIGIALYVIRTRAKEK